jgi:hypothetical protein
MHKKRVIGSRLPDRQKKRILLARETIRTLTSEELSQAVGGSEIDHTGCPCGSRTSSDEVEN